MKTEYNNTKKARGFSLVEMLVVISVIGIIAAIAVPTIGNITSSADESAAKRNAQTAASLYAGAISAGAEFTATDKSAILTELAGGKAGVDVAGSEFKMAELSATAKEKALEYLEFDTTSELLVYVPEGAAEEEVESEWFQYWAGGTDEWGANDVRNIHVNAHGGSYEFGPVIRGQHLTGSLYLWSFQARER